MRVLGVVALALVLSFPAIDARAQSAGADLYVVMLATASNTTLGPSASIPEALRGKSLYWRQVRSGNAVSYQLCLGFFETRSDAEGARQQLAARFREARVLSVSPKEPENLLKAQQQAGLAPPAPPAEETPPVPPPPPPAAADINPAATSPTPARSQDVGLYAGIGIGQSGFRGSCQGLGACSEKDPAAKIFGGYRLNKNFALEAGWVDLGKTNASTGAGNVSMSAKGFEVSGVAMLPVAREFSLLARWGFFKWLTGRNDGTGLIGSGSSTGSDATYGLGGNIDFKDGRLALRGEWQRYKYVGSLTTTRRGDVDFLSAGLVFKF
jgi:OmpA-OmpF porin, OOP family